MSAADKLRMASQMGVDPSVVEQYAAMMRENPGMAAAARQQFNSMSPEQMADVQRRMSSGAGAAAPPATPTPVGSGTAA
eukprot:CAMPEP_0118978194 /NCGR_PEP_ID=MMETSP1173-20130426/23100_1 /TAXON_ID=1034831 /ORGANISM="Rhizochromulina marina cf, Strain CCMP1243" /LENGTH=78 /DNA_ID=CAMNT_0006928375 /DNA_START=8 /DNA_END=241 /DNA_ORIENTATION=+